MLLAQALSYARRALFPPYSVCYAYAGYFSGFIPVAMVVLSTPDHVNATAVPEVPLALSSSILARLRLETRREHSAVERAVDLMGSTLTRAAYTQRLVQFYGFYAPLEAALQTHCAQGDDRLHDASAYPSMLFLRMNKTRLLWQDLRHLQIDTDSLPLCRDLPSVQSWAQALGCLYVLEGATLGGRLITQHIQATLGIMPATGGSFFDGYAGDTARMWHAMRQILVRYAVDVQAENAMVASAISTFTRLQHWCESANNLQSNEANDDLAK